MASDESVQKMDEQIARSKYSSVIQNSLWQVVSNGPAIWKGPNGQDYIYEQSLVEKNTKPLVWGVGCTVITFICFRLNASRTFQQFRRTYIRPSAPAPAIKPPAATSPLERRNELRHEMMTQAISVPKDLLLSIALGLSATAFLMDYDQIQQDLQRVPGLPGRSVLADTMCPNMIQAYNKTPPRVWQEDYLNDETLISMSIIVSKCRKRAKLEAAERQRRGLADNEPVSIPFPGFV